MDPIANMLVAIKNAYMAKKPNLDVPYSRIKFEIIKVLSDEKFIGKIQKQNSQISIELLYEENKPKITQIKRVSKLGLRQYSKAKNIKTIRGGRGITILTTSKGIMTGKNAKNKNLGGEVICQIW